MRIAERITGVPAPRIHAAPGVMKATDAAMGIVERIVPVHDAYSSEFLRVSAGVTYIGDNDKARRQLAHAPRSLEQGLRGTLEHEMCLLSMR